MQTSMPPGGPIQPGTPLPVDFVASEKPGPALPGATKTTAPTPPLPGSQPQTAPTPTPAEWIEEAKRTNVIIDKELRRDLDAQLQKLKSAIPSRERALAVTKLQEAIMWLGMDLKRLNEPNPYPQSYNPNSPAIEPTADGLKL